MHELPFGARVSPAFVQVLKWATANAINEGAGLVVASLCFTEKQQVQEASRGSSEEGRIDFEREIEVPSINRLASEATRPRRVTLTESGWTLRFDKPEHPPDTTFLLRGAKIHISKAVQARLKGATLDVVDHKIVVSYERS